MKLDWSKLSDIAQVVEAFVVAISLFFIWYQLRQQTKFTRAANAHALVDMVSPVRLQIIQDRALAELYFTGPKKYEAFDEIDKFRYRRLIGWALHFYENAFIQKQGELLDNKVYSQWDENLRDFIVNQNVKQVWKDMKENFNDDFKVYLAKLIQESETSAPEAQLARPIVVEAKGVGSNDSVPTKVANPKHIESA